MLFQLATSFEGSRSSSLQPRSSDEVEHPVATASEMAASARASFIRRHSQQTSSSRRNSQSVGKSVDSSATPSTPRQLATATTVTTTTTTTNEQNNELEGIPKKITLQRRDAVSEFSAAKDCAIAQTMKNWQVGSFSQESSLEDEETPLVKESPSSKTAAAISPEAVQQMIVHLAESAHRNPHSTLMPVTPQSTRQFIASQQRLFGSQAALTPSERRKRYFPIAHHSLYFLYRSTIV